MAGLKAIKGKIRSTQKTAKVTKAMEAVSAAKMRKSQNAAFGGRAYARAAVAVLARVSGSQELSKNVFSAVRPIAKALYIVITSDKGLAGGLNSGVLKAAMLDIKTHGFSKDVVSVIAVGRKANDFFATRGYSVEAYHEHKSDVVSHDLIDSIVSEAAQRFGTGAVDVVRVVYQNFISTFEQRPTLRTIFPLSLGELSKVVADIVPAKGAFSEKGEILESPASYAVESSSGDVLGTLLPMLASVFVYHALLESQASEHSARMVAMKSASDKAREMTKELTLEFNKARQAAITREVSEITGGIEAMAS